MGGRKGLMPVVAAIVAVLVIVIGVPLTVVSGYLPPAITAHRWLWIGVTCGLLALIGVLTWWSSRQGNTQVSLRDSQVPPTTGWVDRPELASVVRALTGSGSGPVAVTTGLVGAGGFGKTMLAARSCQDRRVLQRFRGGVCWVTVGRETDGGLLAARISDEIKKLGGKDTGFTTVEAAGQALAAALETRGRMLLVADDVWTFGQMQPFLVAGRAARLLVTTRRPAVLAQAKVPGPAQFMVDRVPESVQRRLLARNLPTIPGSLERELLELTGGWPLLLELVNQRLADAIRHDATVEAAAAEAAARLARDGPDALDINDPGSRNSAVAATVDYSLDDLEPAERDRFYELSVFAEDAEIPVDVAALLWGATASADAARARVLLERLDGLSLLSLAGAGDGSVMLVHDVIRDLADGRLGQSRAAGVHMALVDAARQLAGSDGTGGTAWWRLPDTASGRYLRENLCYHLEAADLVSELDQVCSDLRFIAVRLSASGPAAVESDLARTAGPAVVRLRRAITQNAHLLGPAEPPDAVVTVMTSRLGSMPEVAAQLPALRASLGVWTAQPTWPLPDQPSDELRRVLTGLTSGLGAVAITWVGSRLATPSDDGTVRTWNADGTPNATLTGHTGRVHAMAIAPGGRWLATASDDGTVRTWDADGTPRATLTGRAGQARAVAIAPDGSWLVTAGYDGTVRTWDANGTARATLTGHTFQVLAVAISPDGRWLATASNDGTARTWDADGTLRAILTGHTGSVEALAIASDGSWLATASNDGTARTWDADGTPRATLTGHANWVRAVAISPDGSWLATGDYDGTARTWDADGTPRSTLTGHTGPVEAVAIAPDGSWLATAGFDGTARTWDIGDIPRGNAGDNPATDLISPLLNQLRRDWVGHVDLARVVAIAPDGSWLATVGDHGTARTWNADGTPRATLTGHTSWVYAVAIAPDGSWLATASHDGTARTWNADGTPRATLTGHTGPVEAVAIAPDGSWLATAGDDRTARTWNADGTLRATLTGHTGRVSAVAIAPDGSWLATAGYDRTARTWDADGTPRATLTGHTELVVDAVAIAPDGSWLATASIDGTARTWDADGTPRATLTGHTNWVTAVAISPDGSWLATASLDRTIRVWDAAARGSLPSNVTLVRVEGAVETCAWLRSGVYAGGRRGIYRFSLRTPTQ